MICNFARCAVQHCEITFHQESYAPGEELCPLLYESTTGTSTRTTWETKASGTYTERKSKDWGSGSTLFLPNIQSRLKQPNPRENGAL